MFVSLFMIFIHSAFAGLERIAVLEFVTFGTQEIPNHEILLYSDLLRVSFTKELNTEEFDVITRESLEVFMNDNEDVVCSDSCEIETAKTIGADFVVSGTLIYTSGLYYLTLKLHKTDSGKLLSSSSIKLEHYQDLGELMPFLGKELLGDAKLVGVKKRNFIQQFLHRLSYKNVSISCSPSDTHVKHGATFLCISTPCDVELPKKEVLLEFSRYNYKTEAVKYNIKKTNIIQNKLQSELGTLSIVSKDVRTATINNTEYELPYEQKLPEGQYDIKAKKECFAPFDKTVPLRAESMQKLDIELHPKVESVQYTVRDQYENTIAAEIFVDDKKIGMSNHQIDVSVCAKKLTVRVREFEQTVHTDILKSQNFSFELPLEGTVFQTSLVHVAPFEMGSSTYEEYREPNEKPHDVVLTKDFVMMNTEITNKLYSLVMNKPSPSVESYKGISLVGNHKPVQNITWVQAAVFANSLSRKEGLTPCYKIRNKTVRWPRGFECTGWRLPTEAEWEYAASITPGGKKTRFSGTDSYSRLCAYSNIADQTTYSYFEWGDHSSPTILCSDKEVTLAEVGQYKPNAFGLYDMTGNLWEWVWDGYGTYSSKRKTNPKGINSSYRVLRGGSWTTDPENVRNAHRYKAHKYKLKKDVGKNFGFRLVRSVDK